MYIWGVLCKLLSFCQRVIWLTELTTEAEVRLCDVTWLSTTRTLLRLLLSFAACTDCVLQTTLSIFKLALHLWFHLPSVLLFFSVTLHLFQLSVYLVVWIVHASFVYLHFVQKQVCWLNCTCIHFLGTNCRWLNDVLCFELSIITLHVVILTEEC